MLSDLTEDDRNTYLPSESWSYNVDYNNNLSNDLDDIYKRCALREFEEETGCNLRKITGFKINNITKDEVTTKDEIINFVYKIDDTKTFNEIVLNMRETDKVPEITGFIDWKIKSNNESNSQDGSSSVSKKYLKYKEKYLKLKQLGENNVG